MAQPYRVIRPGEIRYVQKRTIAWGGFSDIYLGVWTNNERDGSEQLAIKCFRGSHLDDPEQKSTFDRRLRKEVTTWWHAQNHPNILPFHGIFYETETDPPTLVAPFRLERNILVFLENRPNADRRHLSIGVVEGMVHLHRFHIVHGDLTPKNILIHLDHRGRVFPQISDFGRAKILGVEGFTGSLYYSCRYAAPEVHQVDDHLQAPPTVEIPRRATNELLTYKSDVYSIGMVLLQILSDIPPYSHLTESQIPLALKIKQEPDFQTHNSADHPMRWVWQLLQRCWMFNGAPKDRYTAKKCLSSLQALMSAPPQTVMTNNLN